MRRMLLLCLVLTLHMFLPACGDSATGPLREESQPVAQSRPNEKETSEKIQRLHDQAISQYRDGKLIEARATLKLILALDDSDARAWYNLACVEARRKENAAALKALAKAVDNGYADADGIARDKDLQPLRETEAYREALERARQLQQGKQLTEDEAPGQLQKAQKIADINRRLIPLFKAKKYDQAKELLAKILEIDPNNAIAHYNLACAHSRMQDVDDAVDALNRSLELGYSDFRHMRRDPDLANVRRTREFRMILARKDEIQRSRAERLAVKLKDRFGEGYLHRIAHHDKLLFATNTDEKTLADMNGFLTAYAESLWRDLFKHRFEQYVTVVIPTDDTFRNKRLGGYYNHGARMLVARTLGMELTHEFTHALHAADQDGYGQRHPIWVTEGLATLFESSRLEDGKIVPEDNVRLLAIKRLAKRRKHLPFRDFFGLSHREFMQKQYKQGVSYAQGRYIMMYLHENGKLKEWYDALVKGFEDDRTGTAAMEKVFGKKIEEVENDWRRWVLKRKNPPLRLRTNQGYIGIQTRGQVDGLRIVRVVQGSGADKAGLSPNDVLVKVDGRRVSNGQALLRIVAASDVGDRLMLEIRRDGEYRKLPVTLGPMPKKIPLHKTKADRPDGDDSTTQPDEDKKSASRWILRRAA